MDHYGTGEVRCQVGIGARKAFGSFRAYPSVGKVWVDRARYATKTRFGADAATLEGGSGPKVAAGGSGAVSRERKVSVYYHVFCSRAAPFQDPHQP